MAWMLSSGIADNGRKYRFSLCVATGLMLLPSLAVAVECGDFRGESAHIVDSSNVVVGGRWLELIDGEWIDRSVECERAQVSVVVDELKDRGDWATVAGEGNDSVLWVFFDSTCGYCQLLHDGLASYAAHGYEVRYLGYPRAGVDSDAAFVLADYGLSIEAVRAHHAAGIRLGLRGTPMLIVDDRIIKGYVPAERLEAYLRGGG